MPGGCTVPRMQLALILKEYDIEMLLGRGALQCLQRLVPLQMTIESETADRLGFYNECVSFGGSQVFQLGRGIPYISKRITDSQDTERIARLGKRRQRHQKRHCQQDPSFHLKQNYSRDIRSTESSTSLRTASL